MSDENDDRDRAAMQAAWIWLTGEEARDEAAKNEKAIGWIVLVTEAEFGSLDLYGIYDDPIEALKEAEQFEHDLNVGNPPSEIPWICRVLPLMPKITQE